MEFLEFQVLYFYAQYFFPREFRTRTVFDSRQIIFATTIVFLFVRFVRLSECLVLNHTNSPLSIPLPSVTLTHSRSKILVTAGV